MWRSDVGAMDLASNKGEAAASNKSQQVKAVVILRACWRMSFLLGKENRVAQLNEPAKRISNVYRTNLNPRVINERYAHHQGEQPSTPPQLLLLRPMNLLRQTDPIHSLKCDSKERENELTLLSRTHSLRLWISAWIESSPCPIRTGNKKERGE